PDERRPRSRRYRGRQCTSCSRRYQADHCGVPGLADVRSIRAGTRDQRTGPGLRGRSGRSPSLPRTPRTRLAEPMNTERKTPSRLLEGVRVLELSSMYAAPTCGRMLRDFGADVIKVEDPGVGDYARQWRPRHNGIALGFARLNAGKRSIAIDLRDEKGRE